MSALPTTSADVSVSVPSSPASGGVSARLRAARTRYFQQRRAISSLDEATMDAMVDAALRLASAGDVESIESMSSSLHLHGDAAPPASTTHSTAHPDETGIDPFPATLVGHAFDAAAYLDDSGADAQSRDQSSHVRRAPRLEADVQSPLLSRLHGDAAADIEQSVVAATVAVTPLTASGGHDSDAVEPFDPADSQSHEFVDVKIARVLPAFESSPNEVCIEYDTDADAAFDNREESGDSDCDYVREDEFIDGEQFSDADDAVSAPLSHDSQLLLTVATAARRLVSANAQRTDAPPSAQPPSVPEQECAPLFDNELLPSQPESEVSASAAASVYALPAFTARMLAVAAENHDELDAKFLSLLSPSDVAGMLSLRTSPPVAATNLTMQAARASHEAAFDPDDLVAAVLRTFPREQDVQRPSSDGRAPAVVLLTHDDDALAAADEVADDVSEWSVDEDGQDGSYPSSLLAPPRTAGLGFLLDDRPGDCRMGNFVDVESESDAYAPSMRSLDKVRTSAAASASQ